MIERGDFVTTWLNGQPRFDKPILTYWLQALSVSLFGVHEFAFRLPSALAGLGWVGAILVFTGRLADRATAYAAALIAATSLGVGVIGRGATADALLNLFLALAMFDIYRYMEQPLARYRHRAFLWMALGLLTKGPVALLIPFAVSALAFTLHGKARAWRRAALDPAGWLILLAVAGPWYLLEYLRQGDAFIAGFVLRHNVERFMSPLQGHRGNLFYYLPVALLLLLPYSGLFLRILPGVRTLRARPLDTFLWCWFLFVLLFSSIAGTKLPHYLLYGVSPLFVLMAMRRRLLVSRWARLRAAVPAAGRRRRLADRAAILWPGHPRCVCARGIDAARSVRQRLPAGIVGPAAGAAGAGFPAALRSLAKADRHWRAVFGRDRRSGAAGARPVAAGAGEGGGAVRAPGRPGGAQLAIQRAQL
jgi:4-amino-4-deoxy-L-arabinose transferase-like glycosyltransferase